MGGVRFHFLFVGEQFRQDFFRADVMRLDATQFLLRLNAGSDRHETVEAARVETAVFVLGAAVHISSGLFRRFNDVRRSSILMS